MAIAENVVCPLFTPSGAWTEMWRLGACAPSPTSRPRILSSSPLLRRMFRSTSIRQSLSRLSSRSLYRGVEPRVIRAGTRPRACVRLSRCPVLCPPLFGGLVCGVDTRPAPGHACLTVGDGAFVSRAHPYATAGTGGVITRCRQRKSPASAGLFQYESQIRLSSPSPRRREAWTGLRPSSAVRPPWRRW